MFWLQVRSFFQIFQGHLLVGPIWMYPGCIYPEEHKCEPFSDICWCDLYRNNAHSYDIWPSVSWCTFYFFWFAFIGINVFIVPFPLMFLSFQTMQYCGMSSTANFAHPSIGTTLCIVFFGDITKASITSITSSYIVFWFCLPWFDSKILDILQYHDGHHKLDTLPYLSSQCLVPSLWNDSEIYVLLICFAFLMVSLHIDQQVLLKREDH